MAIYTDVWNRTIFLINTSKDETLVSKDKMLLSQYATAAGTRIKSELNSFLKEAKVPATISL